ncbi:MAG TPA: LuxR C-terminal-related transcriptional regulator [Anaerolineales bacterium]|nr:LuxR C-terminal-related transcriptional regulator [Anaerolineales bacterium]
MVQLLTTKLFIPSTRPERVFRPRLIERLNESLRHRPGVTLISAPAGFGKTTLISEWIAGCGQPAAWLSLDEGDNDPARFLAYLIAALQTVAANIGEGISNVLQAPQPPPVESILTDLLNEITALPEHFILVLEDYHAIDARPVDQALTFLLEHQPPQLHLVITTREDPDLPLPRLRARGQLTEVRAADLRFTLAEATEFLNQVMRLPLSRDDIAALEHRTEGWIAGLQLAALSMQAQNDTAGFLQSFTGSHHFVMDYLMEEVLHQQPKEVQMFLLHTSILDRMCGPLCDAVLLNPSFSGQATLEYLERSNLFIVPLDNERRWYRYHHLFADLLRQRLGQSLAFSAEGGESHVSKLHIRASQWYEDNGLQLEAFRHAAAANDIERAERLIDGKGIPLHFSGGVVPILEWLDSLPAPVKNVRPSLWWRQAAMLLINGQTAGVQENLQAAEAALADILRGAEPDDESRKLIGRIAAATATLALTRYDIETMLAQSRRALAYLEPSNLSLRGNAYWTMGFAYDLLGDRIAARQAFLESISLSQAAGAIFTIILATIGLANIQELDNELYQAAETCRRVLQWAGDRPQQVISEVHLGLARILYEWNDLESAEHHAHQSLHLARQYESFIDRFVFGEVFLARLKLARGDVSGAASILAETDQSARQRNFVHRIPEIAAAQVLTLLRQGDLATAAHLAQEHKLPIPQARVHLAQGDSSAALTVLESYRQQVEAKGWKDEQLKTMVLQAAAYYAHDEKDKALQVLSEALVLAEPGGFIRIFIDEGEPMAQLLKDAAAQGINPDYTSKLLAAFETEKQKRNGKSPAPVQSLVEPLSSRELEVLQLIAQGLSNDEIGKRLYLALDTVKGHNRRIFDKLQVQRRTEAVARARELGLL